MNICKNQLNVTNINTVVSTNGGTSDGGFVAKVCNQVIELGLTNRSIHKINESIREDDLEILKIFIKIFSRKYLLTNKWRLQEVFYLLFFVD